MGEAKKHQKKRSWGGSRTYTKHNVILAVASEVKGIQFLEELE